MSFLCPGGQKWSLQLMLWDRKKLILLWKLFPLVFLSSLIIKYIEFSLSLSNRGNRVQGYYCNPKALSMFPIMKFWSKFGYYQNEHEFYNHLKCGFCKKLLLYECNSDQLPTFFHSVITFGWVCCCFAVAPTQKWWQNEKSGQLVRVAFVKK